MADKQGTRASSRLRQDSLIEQMVPDPARLPAVGGQTIRGFLGRSSRDGYWRLYQTPQLDDYLEFSEEDVIHTQPLPTDREPLGGTMVWLSADAKVQRTRTTTQSAQADFLQGDIASAFLGSTGVEGLMAPSGQAAIWTIFTSKPCAVATIVIVIYSAVKCKPKPTT